MSGERVFFVSGHMDLTSEEFAKHYEPRIREAFQSGGKFVVGDASGCDSMAQQLLSSLLWALAYHGEERDVRIYHMLERPRNRVEYVRTVGGFASDEERDAAMTAASTHDIAWVRPGKKKRRSGTAKNLERRAALQLAARDAERAGWPRRVVDDEVCGDGERWIKLMPPGTWGEPGHPAAPGPGRPPGGGQVAPGPGRGRGAAVLRRCQAAGRRGRGAPGGITVIDYVDVLGPLNGKRLGPERTRAFMEEFKQIAREHPLQVFTARAPELAPHADTVWALSQAPAGSGSPIRAHVYKRRSTMSSGFPVSFPGQQEYGEGFDKDSRSRAAARIFQSTTRLGLATDGSHVYGERLEPGALVSQHRYPKGAAVWPEPVPFETRLGLVVGVRGTSMDDQVDVMWSDWAPAREPEGLRARQQVQARSANE